MNAISKASAFPATVQPGIPTLPELPLEWVRKPIGRLLNEVRRPVKMADDDAYRLVTVKRARGGVVERGVFRGREISVKSQFELREGDFLISKRQIVHGACGIVPQALSGSIVSNEYTVLVPEPDLDLQFLGYLAHSIYFQQTCFHSSIGVHIEKMIFKQDRWLNWHFNLPPLPEQKKIAEILSTWDKAIETTEKLLANAEAQKKALMQQLLTGKRRLKGFEGEWREVPLSEVTDFIRDGTHGTHERVGDGVPMISAANISSHHDIDLTSAPRIPRRDYEIIHKKYKISEGDVLLTVVGTLGRTAMVNRFEEFTAQRSVAILRASNNFCPEFLLYVTQSHKFQTQLRKRANVTAQPGVYLGELAKILMPQPSLDEQHAIVEIVRDAFAQASKISRSVDVLRAEKKALMQQLLTGKRRVGT